MTMAKGKDSRKEKKKPKKDKKQLLNLIIIS